MKRWIVIALVVTALVVLVSPGIVGRLAERSLQQSIDWLDSDSPELTVETESFDRGWFSSEGRHRVTLMRFVSTADAGELPSLIIETRFDHGLFPISSMSREDGSLQPGLARAVSTFHIETPDGKVIELPGQAFTRIGLGGETDVHYVLEEGSQQLEQRHVEWGGANIFAQFDPNTRAVSIKGKIEPIALSADDSSASMGAIEITANQRMTEYGFGIGAGEVRTEAMQFTRQDGVSGGFDELVLQGESNLEERRVNGSYNMSLAGLTVPMLGDVAVQVAFSVSGLDAASLGNIYKTVNSAKGSADPSQAMAEIYPLIENDLQSLVAAGGSISLDQLDVTLPQGEVKSAITLSVDKSNADADFSWSAIALLARASADISVPAMLVEMAAMLNPQAESLIDSGLLIQKGDTYEMQAEYAQGLLTINGAPFPIPLSGF